MIGINQFRWASPQPRVAQPHRRLPHPASLVVLDVYAHYAYN